MRKVAGIMTISLSLLGAAAPAQTSATETQASQAEARNYPRNIRLGMNVSFLSDNIDRVMEESIQANDIPGGVVEVIRRTPDGVARSVFSKAYGNRAVEPATEPATLDTIYDMASLTKSMATAISIMQLVEQGKIRVTDKVSKYIPEWKNTPEEESQKKLLDKLKTAISSGKINALYFASGMDPDATGLVNSAKKEFPDLFSNRTSADFNLLPRDRESITIRHLLTHTAGLPPFERYYAKYPEGHARKKIVSDIAQVKLRGPVGGQFIYSDLGFIVLGDIVERVSGLPLDQYAAKNIFEPLEMTDTGFNPPADKLSRVAPTEWVNAGNHGDAGSTRTMIRGRVHDGNAFVQDGVSGHAGLFSTGPDCAKFFGMLLSSGRVTGRELKEGRYPQIYQILSPATIAVMTSDQARLPEGETQRGLGWDLTSPYNGQKGDIFQSGYGHTGFTGTSAWVVPEEGLAVIILSNRVHPDGKGDSGPMRAKIANIVAGSIVTSYQQKTSEK